MSCRVFYIHTLTPKDNFIFYFVMNISHPCPRMLFKYFPVIYTVGQPDKNLFPPGSRPLPNNDSVKVSSATGITKAGGNKNV